MKIFLLIAILFNSTLSLASDCEFAEKFFERALTLKERNQFLLSSTLLSQSISLDCKYKNKYRYFYGSNMIKLGEKIEALSEFNKIEANSKFFKPSEIQKKLFLGYEGKINQNGEQRIQVWINKRDKNKLKKLELKHLSISQQEALNSYVQNISNTKKKSPKLAASLSMVPGLGQAYLGAYQSAAISFAINSLFLLAAKDFEDQKQYGAASASYLVFSITYLGNILNSHRTANNINNDRLKEHDDKLWNELFQEL